MALVYNEATGDFDDVQVPPIIRSFKVQQSVPFYGGDEITLVWQIDGANHVFLDEEEQTKSNITIQLSEAGQRQFKLKATNADGISEKTIVIEIVKKPVFSIDTSASVLHKDRNESVVFSYSVENAKSLKLRYGNKIENLPLSGEITFTPMEDIRFDFEAEGLEGGRNFHHIIPIQIREAAKVSFKVSRQFSYPNLPIKLSWNVEYATNVSIDDFGDQPNEGSIEVTPGVDTTYVLRVNDAFGATQRSITVRMLPIPVIKQLFVPAPRIEEDLAITYKPPQFKTIVPVPTFETSLIKIDLPKVPALRTSPFFVNKIEDRKEKGSFRNYFKSLYSYFFRK